MYAVESDAVPIDLALLRKWLIWSVAFVCIIGLGTEFIYALNGRNDIWGLNRFASLSLEANLPTWFASSLLLCCSYLLALVAQSSRLAGKPYVKHWYVLALIFLYISLDETAQIHEKSYWKGINYGVLRFSWVISGAAATLVAGLAYLRFLLHLPALTRRRIIVAAMFYVGGALLMELPLGYWKDAAGSANLTYRLIDWVEETMELTGTALFLYALAFYRLEIRGLNKNERSG